MFTERRPAGEPGVEKIATGHVSFDTAAVDAAVTGSIFHGKLHHFTTAESTQTLAIAAAQAGAAAGQVYVADEQTAGRGRGGHSWHSEPGSGLYVTVLLRPRVEATRALLLSLAAGLAAQSAVERVTGFRIDLRWPNDLVTIGPASVKLGGILTESAMQPDGSLRYAAIGLGINLNQLSMPKELADISTSLRMLLGVNTAREDLLSALLPQLAHWMERVEQSPDEVLAAFAEHSSWVRGKRVRVGGAEGYTAVTDGLTDAGLLRVICSDGKARDVLHGGVRESA